eukprot:SAG31_NODE_5605_length_2426_cov_1.841856_1_plen_362_part_10
MVLVTLILWTVFAIVGIQFFKGRFFSCNDKSGVVSFKKQCTGVFVDESGALVKRLWENPHANFDDFFEAMFALFSLSTNNDWVLTAHRAIDGVAPDEQPVIEHSPAKMLYFVLFIVMSNFFFMNLFVGVIYEKYVARKNQGLEELTKMQRQWLDVIAAMKFVDPVPATTGAIFTEMAAGRLKVYKLVTAGGFDNFIIGCIIANCAVMAATFYDEPLWWETTQAVLNLLFTFIFTCAMALHYCSVAVFVEAVLYLCRSGRSAIVNNVWRPCRCECGLKLYAFGPAQYFRDSWNQFDFAVVVGSLLDVAMTYLDISLFSSSMFRIIRIAKVIGRARVSFPPDVTTADLSCPACMPPRGRSSPRQ